MYGSVEWQ